MPHKLLITYGLNGKAVRGEEVLVILRVQNIGDAVFSGGKFSLIQLVIANTMISRVAESELPKIPLLQPKGEPFSTAPLSFSLGADGVGWLYAAVLADDAQAVEFYQTPQSSTIGGMWQSPFYIVNREHAEIINLLGQIVNLLKEPKTL